VDRRGKHHRPWAIRHRQTHTSLWGPGWLRANAELKVHFTTAAALVYDLIEAQDERRLQRMQKATDQQNLLIIDELGFVPLSKIETELLFESDIYLYEHWLYHHYLEPTF
jgi:hypothetical protein